MKIAIVGCGAVGSYYGARLAGSGHEVHFLLRSDYEVVRRQGLRILSPQGNLHLHPHCAKRPEEIGPCDLVVIALKTTANDQFPRLLPPLLDRHSAVLTLQNGLGNEEALARLFPPGQILGGLCFVCLNRLEPGLIRHLDYGLIVLGEYLGPTLPRTRLIAEAFQQAGVPCRLTENLAEAHWDKLTWNIPFNGLGVASAAGFEAAVSGQPPATPLGGCLTTQELLADPRWLGLIRELILEVVAAAKALGFDLKPSLAEVQIDRTRSMGPYRASTAVDFERGLPLEMGSLFLEPLRLARQVGVEVPRLQALCQLLEKMDPAVRSCGSGPLPKSGTLPSP